VYSKLSFEEALADLITEYLDREFPRDDIISGLEIHLMAQQEEEAE
jgi:hypothetical protein